MSACGSWFVVRGCAGNTASSLIENTFYIYKIENTFYEVRGCAGNPASSLIENTFYIYKIENTFYMWFVVVQAETLHLHSCLSIRVYV